MTLKDTLKMRQSCRSFKEDVLDRGIIREMLIAANAAPVGMKKYEELKITVVCKKEIITGIDAVSKEKFKESPYVMYYSTYQAPCLIIISGKKCEEPYQSMLHASVGCILENVTLAAAELGLGSVFMSGITKAIEDNSELCDVLKIREDFKPLAALAVGWPKNRLEERELTTNKFVTDILE